MSLNVHKLLVVALIRIWTWFSNSTSAFTSVQRVNHLTVQANWQLTSSFRNCHSKISKQNNFKCKKNTNSWTVTKIEIENSPHTFHANMETSKGKFICINCAHPVDELYTNYSASVTRIVNCVSEYSENNGSSNEFHNRLIKFDCFDVILGEMPRNCRQIHRIWAHGCCYRLGFVVAVHLSAYTLQHRF